MRLPLAAMLLCGCLACHSAPRPDPALRTALVERALADQDQMLALAGHLSDTSYKRQLASTLAANADWLDSLVRQRGWPGYAAVDSDGVAAAFLIAQHADERPQAQERFLAAMQMAVRAADANPRDLAFLEDRVRKAAGRPQLYGTQPAYDSAGVAAQPEVEAPESLDVRRASVGLPPMAEYLEKVRAVNARLRAGQQAAP